MDAVRLERLLRKGGRARFEIQPGKDVVLLQISAATPNDARFVRELLVEPDTVYRFACRSAATASGLRPVGRASLLRILWMVPLTAKAADMTGSRLSFTEKRGRVRTGFP